MKVEVEKQPGFVSSCRLNCCLKKCARSGMQLQTASRGLLRFQGYRPGKAPRAVIDKRFRKEIQVELTKKLVSKVTSKQSNKSNCASRP